MVKRVKKKKVEEYNKKKLDAMFDNLFDQVKDVVQENDAESKIDEGCLELFEELFGS